MATKQKVVATCSKASPEAEPICEVKVGGATLRGRVAFDRVRTMALQPIRRGRRSVTQARGARRPRGAGRPRVRRVTRSSSRSGVSGDDLPEPDLEFVGRLLRWPNPVAVFTTGWLR